MVFFSTRIFGVLPNKWSRKFQVQAETKISESAPRIDVDNREWVRNFKLLQSSNKPSECGFWQLEFRHLLVTDLTGKIIREFNFATAQGGFGDVWKCRCSGDDGTFEVYLFCARFKLSPNHDPRWPSNAWGSTFRTTILKTSSSRLVAVIL